jgi:hypothetical protein
LVLNSARNEVLTSPHTHQVGVSDIIAADFVQTANQFNPYDYQTIVQPLNLGRSNVMNNEGKVAGKFEALYQNGGRGFSIFKFTPTTSELVFDSGSFTERTVAEFLVESGTADQQEQYRKRLDRKGTEPEGITVMTYEGRVIAAVTFERAGTVGLFDVTDPANVYFLQYVTHPELFNPEAVNFVSASDSPSGVPLLVINGEGDDVDGTHRLMVFELAIRVDTGSPTASTRAPSTSAPQASAAVGSSASVVAMAAVVVAWFVVVV